MRAFLVYEDEDSPILVYADKQSRAKLVGFKAMPQWRQFVRLTAKRLQDWDCDAVTEERAFLSNADLPPGVEPFYWGNWHIVRQSNYAAYDVSDIDIREALDNLLELEADWKDGETILVQDNDNAFPDQHFQLETTHRIKRIT